MSEKGIKSVFKKVRDVAVKMIMEEDIEIIDNGLDNADNMEDSKPVVVANTTEESVAVKEEIVEEVKEEPVNNSVSKIREVTEEVKAKAKNPFVKPKSKTLEDDLFKNEEEKSTMELIKESPVAPLEIIETNTVENKSSFKYEKAVIEEENVTDELTDSQKEQQMFFDMIGAKDKALSNIRRMGLFKNIEQEMFRDGFEDTYFSLMESIEDNMVLEVEDKNKTMAKVLDLLYKTSDAEDSVYDYFKYIRHELHMVQNNLGIYGQEVYNAKDAVSEAVREYRIAELFERNETRGMLLDSDAKKFGELMSLTETMILKIEADNLLKTMPQKTEALKDEYVDMLWLSNNICDVLVGIETLKNDIVEIENNKGRFDRAELLDLR